MNWTIGTSTDQNFWTGSLFPITGEKQWKMNRSTEILDIIQKKKFKVIEMNKEDPLWYTKSEDIKKFIHTPMTRNRDLKKVKEGYPNLYSYLEESYSNNPGKSLIEFWSWEGSLLDDLIDTYKIKWIGIDWNHPTRKTKYLKWKKDIRDFNSLPKWLSDGISLCTFLYIPNSIFWLETIFNKMKPWSKIRIDMGPKKMYSKSMRDYLKENNKSTWLSLYQDTPVVNDKWETYFSNLAVYLYKENEDSKINVPDKYTVIRWKEYRAWSEESREEIKASPYFCHYFLENDEELILSEKELKEKYQENTKNSFNNSK